MSFRSWSGKAGPAGQSAPAGRLGSCWLHRGTAAGAALGLAAGISLLPSFPAVAAPDPDAVEFEPGTSGLKDPYFPKAGNGGYDVKHYQLDLDYHPPMDKLAGTATITARAKQDLETFNLDLDGLSVESVQVNRLTAAWYVLEEGELTVTAPQGILRGKEFTVVVKYEGVPKTITEPGTAGFIHTEDGAVVTGHPLSAPTWFPSNNHPSDRASFSYNISVPEGWEALANGALKGKSSKAGRTTWSWESKEQLPPYLASINIGEFDIEHYAKGGTDYWNALDPALKDVVTPRNGNGLAWSHTSDASYKRLARTVSVPGDGAELSFWLHRDTEPGWDFAFVEARTAGSDDWTTLKDTTGHATADTGQSCPAWHEVHPFLKRYQTDDGEGGCQPEGTSGQWWAASGASDGWEKWEFDLEAYKGKDVELSITYASDITGQHDGVLIEDIIMSTDEGSTSFENDRNRDRLEGWTVAGAPEGSPANTNDWEAGVSTPTSIGARAQKGLDRQPEILSFLSKRFGDYPYGSAGGVVTEQDGLGFALESQSRPIYAKDWFYDPASADSYMVHELAHQWFGADLSVASWKDAWLTDGFATYAQWLWNEEQDLGTAQETFDFYAGIDSGEQFWKLRLTDPKADHLFDPALQARGAMVLHALREELGDKQFFGLLRSWAEEHSGRAVDTRDFTEFAEAYSGQDLRELFELWLFTPGKPGTLKAS
ncbi:peptidase M1 membrane alanine aminopeptidase [Arthrobacter crystallopoietes BAB-32]|uniref:Peptidase M1 membrane alanine aminopeptidase n=1 Tax=Arthrobacter crystallopoietes BAB-32 TaxID=1246476 RepID=N1V0Z1_9MICC|nr:M1 family metallopeptidase [Arthrobacter crystallopoietes]EMY33694.1 peptidase M1 membrane alanine aminopeptidase [Arthrobacter crystallopoietes BAB-32]